MSDQRLGNSIYFFLIKIFSLWRELAVVTETSEWTPKRGG